MYPITYDQTPPEERNRLTAFFRLIMVIPHMLVALVGAIAVIIAVLAAWVAIVFTGRYPQGLYDFLSGACRWATRLNGYLFLVTDEFPPFDLGEHPEYPVRVGIGPPKESYSRVKAFFRIFLVIPVAIVAYVMQLWMEAVGLVLWLSAVFVGRTSPALTEAQRIPLAYYTRANAFYWLLTEDFPPFDPNAGAAATPPQPAAGSAPGAPPAASPS
jgi:hypothetical protein